jgi:hypothetical protein
MIPLLLSSLGFSARLAMEPQNKFHIGASMISSNYGVSLGLDSRLTQLIYVDIGGFASLNEVDSSIINEDDPKSYAVPRHAIYAMPGWRVPHRYNEKGLNWDAFLRAGFGCVFTKDLSVEDVTHTDPAVLMGVETHLRIDQLGLKLMFKELYFKPYVSSFREEQIFFQPQFSAEMFIQF